MRVAAVNAAGFQGAYAFAPNLYAVPELQQPAQPASPSLTVVGGSSMQVQFGAAPASGGADVNFYRVEYANAAFAAEVQEVDALCVVTHEIQVSETPVPFSVEGPPSSMSVHVAPRAPHHRWCILLRVWGVRYAGGEHDDVAHDPGDAVAVPVHIVRRHGADGAAASGVRRQRRVRVAAICRVTITNTI